MTYMSSLFSFFLVFSSLIYIYLNALPAFRDDPVLSG